jgi:hypothetical protein
MNTLTLFRPIIHLLGCLVLITPLTVPMLAVEPLPARLQNASAEVQKAYLEQQALESLQDKLRAGQHRHALRLQYKQRLVTMMRQEAEARLQSISQQEPVTTDVEARARAMASGLSLTDWLVILCAVVGAGFLLRLRYAADTRSSSV